MGGIARRGVAPIRGARQDRDPKVRTPILMESHAGHSLLLRFDSDEPAFARGFELGRLWALLRERPDEPFEEYVHATSAEMLLRIAEATGRNVQSEEVGGGWLFVTFSPAGVVGFVA